MKLHTLLFALCLITSSLAFTTQTQAQTQSGDFGLGVILGEPTGLSAKVFQGNNRAFALGAAWSFGNEASLHLHADYLIHRFDLISVDSGRLPVY